MNNQTVAGFRLSIQQDRTWSQQPSDDTPLWAQCELALNGPLNAATLQNAIRTVVARHEILRTVFHRQTGVKVPFQVIRDESNYSLMGADVSDLDPNIQRKRLNGLVDQLRTHLDFEKGPLLQTVLAKVGNEKHLLVLSVPALCADLHSLRIVSSEIARAYGDELDTGEEVMQYADVAEWQQELLASEESKPARDYWRDYCRNIDLSAIGTAFAAFERKSRGEFAPAAVLQTLDASVISAIDRDSLSDVLLASWVALLARMTAHPAVTLGCEFDGRSYSELENAVGPFAKVLPLNCDCSEDVTFSALWQQVRRDTAEFRKWQDSFSWSAAYPSQGQVQGPVLPFVFEYFALPQPDLASGVSFSVLRNERCPEQFRLNLAVCEKAGSLDLRFEYDSGSVDRDTVERLSRSYLTLLKHAATHPETLVARLPLLDRAERQSLLVDWNQTAADYPKQRCVHELFEMQAAQTPDAPAVRYENDCLSYRELNERANQLAHYLQALGVGADSPIGLCLERSTNMMVAVLAILKAGGAYVPLSADHPKPRLAQQLVGATALITEARFECLMPSLSGPTVLIDKDCTQWSRQPATNPRLIATAENLAYVIYTSGSTGTPKGVAVRHRNLVNYTSFIQRRLKLDECSDPLHFATVSTLGADLGNTCIYPSLVSGGCLHVIGHDVAADSQCLRAYMAKYSVDVLKIVPSHLMALLNSGGGKEVLPRKYLITGGEVLTFPLLEKIEATGADCEVLNHYGPTETTVGSLALRLKDYDWKNCSAETVPIGRPIANTRIYVLDAQGEPVPVGVAGELYIAGEGVTGGYVGQPGLTAERFVPERFGPVTNAKMYRSGDLVRYLPDGNVEFLGRVDDQVKIRGFRIELGEIESVLLRHAEVKQAVVLAVADEHGDKTIVAYVVASASSDELRRYLREQLPDYMLPTAIIKLSKLPLNANGKIDRQALPKPEDAKGREKEPSLAPRTPGEEVVAAIWEEVLKRDGIGLEDNFFEIGGHSLLATQIASRLGERFGIPVPVRAMFEAPSIAGLAKRMDAARREEQGLLPPAIKSVPRNGDLPLSYAQERLWVLDQMEPNSPLYNIARTLRLRGRLKIAELERALHEILRRHESQRTTFAVKDGHPVQVVHPAMTLPLVIHDLTMHPENLREAEARRISGEEAMRPFDLATGPLLRADLMRLSPEDHVMQLTMHHIISDAWSAGIFLQELGTLYEAFCSGKPSPLPELTIQYADYAVQEREWLQGEVLDKQLAFWRERLKGAPPVLALPLDRPRPSHRTFQGAFETLHISAGTLSAVKKFGRQEGATLFMTLMAAFQALLSKYSGEEQIVVGTDLANRIMPETERMIGFFINILAVRTDLSGNPTFRGLLRRVREELLECYAHQEVPFPKIVQELQPERSASQNPIVQVLFVMQNIPRPKRELAGIQVEAFEVPVISSKFDMAVFVAERPEELIGYWVYSTELFDQSRIQRMARHFENLLQSAVSQPDARLSSLAMLSPEELAQQEAEKKNRKYSQFKKLKTTVPQAVGFAADDGGKQ